MEKVIELLREMIAVIPGIHNPYGLLAYVCLICLVIVICPSILKLVRTQALLRKIHSFPPKDRLSALQLEAGPILLKEKMSPEQWLKSRIHRYAALLIFAGLFLVAFIVAVLFYNSTQAQAPIVMIQNKEPHLSAQLIFEASKGYRERQPTLLVENTGDVAISDMSSALMVGEGVGIDGTPAQIDLQPHSKTEVEFPGSFVAPSKIREINAVLVYRVTDNGPTFHSRFRFPVPRSDQPDRPLLPVAIEEGAGDSGFNQIKANSLQSLADPKGTIIFSAPAAGPNGAGNLIEQVTPNRILKIDCGKHVAFVARETLHKFWNSGLIV